MSFALSTSWNAFRYSSGKELLFEIKGLGVSKIELSFNIIPAMLKDIERAVRNGEIEVTSLHNFCPIPDGLKREEALPDCYSISSLNEEERQEAVKYAKRSIDTAQLLEARAVVLHCGRVEVPDRTRDLIGFYEKGLRDSPEFESLKNDMIRERESLSPAFLRQAIKSLKELDSYAIKKVVALGVETRFYHREIPSFKEVGAILGLFKSSSIYYWHDTGHAQLMENLGFAAHREYLEQYSGRMIGIHLHDISGCRDHQAPPKGGIDFRMIKQYTRKETIKVLEIHHPATAEEIKNSIKYLADTFNDLA